MLSDFLTREDDFLSTAASAEVIPMVSPFVAIPASAGIFFLHHEHLRSIGLEIRIPISSCIRHSISWWRRDTNVAAMGMASPKGGESSITFADANFAGKSLFPSG